MYVRSRPLSRTDRRRVHLGRRVSRCTPRTLPRRRAGAADTRPLRPARHRAAAARSAASGGRALPSALFGASRFIQPGRRRDWPACLISRDSVFARCASRRDPKVAAPSCERCGPHLARHRPSGAHAQRRRSACAARRTSIPPPPPAPTSSSSPMTSARAARAAARSHDSSLWATRARRTRRRMGRHPIHRWRHRVASRAPSPFAAATP